MGCAYRIYTRTYTLLSLLMVIFCMMTAFAIMGMKCPPLLSTCWRSKSERSLKSSKSSEATSPRDYEMAELPATNVVAPAFEPTPGNESRMHEVDFAPADYFAPRRSSPPMSPHQGLAGLDPSTCERRGSSTSSLTLSSPMTPLGNRPEQARRPSLLSISWDESRISDSTQSYRRGSTPDDVEKRPHVLPHLPQMQGSGMLSSEQTRSEANVSTKNVSFDLDVDKGDQDGSSEHGDVGEHVGWYRGMRSSLHQDRIRRLIVGSVLAGGSISGMRECPRRASLVAIRNLFTFASKLTPISCLLQITLVNDRSSSSSSRTVQVW